MLSGKQLKLIKIHTLEENKNDKSHNKVIEGILLPRLDTQNNKITWPPDKYKRKSSGFELKENGVAELGKKRKRYPDEWKEEKKH